MNKRKGEVTREGLSFLICPCGLYRTIKHKQVFPARALGATFGCGSPR